MPVTCEWKGRAPSGNRGAQGRVPPAVSPGAGGSPGTVTVHDNSPQQHLEHLDLTLLRMVLHEAELEYLNERHLAAARKLYWLLELCEAATTIGTGIAVTEATVPVTGVEHDHLAAVHYRVRVLLVQLAQGLDVYGYYPGHVPLTSIDVYEKVVVQLLDLATDIEAAYAEFHDEQRSADQQRRALSRAADLLELKRPELARQSGQIAVEVAETRDQISSLLVEEDILRLGAEAAGDAFKQAIEGEAACDFAEVLAAAAAVAAIATGVGAIAAGLAGLAEMNQLIEKKKLKDTLRQKGDYIVKELKAVKGGLDSIRQGYSDVRQILQHERDGAKLVAQEEEFETTIERFQHLEEAREYRRLMRQYLAVIKARNAKILHVDSLVTRLLELDSEDHQLVVEVERTRGRLVDIFNPRLAEHMVFFERAVARIRADILRAIVMEHRALEYWSLRPSALPGNLQDRSVDHLKVYHANFLTSLLQEMENRNQAPQRFEGPVEFIFSREQNPEEFELLEREGRFTFRISSAHPAFRFYAQTLVSAATVTLYGTEAASSNRIRWVFLRHHGDPTFIDSLGVPHNFQHRSRLRNAYLERLNRSVILGLGGLEGRYAFLSPFATWTFMLEGEEGGQAGTAVVERIGIRFTGLAFARYGNEPAPLIGVAAANSDPPAAPIIRLAYSIEEHV